MRSGAWSGGRWYETNFQRWLRKACTSAVQAQSRLSIERIAKMKQIAGGGQSLRLKRVIAWRKSKLQRFLYIGPEVIKLFILNSHENEIPNADKIKMLTIEDYSCF